MYSSLYSRRHRETTNQNHHPSPMGASRERSKESVYFRLHRRGTLGGDYQVFGLTRSGRKPTIYRSRNRTPRFANSPIKRMALQKSGMSRHLCGIPNKNIIRLRYKSVDCISTSASETGHVLPSRFALVST